MSGEQSFKEWLMGQHLRDDAVGWIAKWFLLKGQGRLPVEEPDTLMGWEVIVERKASKAHKAIGRGALLTAWNEFRGQTDETSVQTMKVFSTIARLRRVVNGHNETGEEEKEETLAVTKFLGPVSSVTVKYGATVNLGNWESARIDYSLHVPCYPEEINQAFEFADQWVGDRVEQEAAKIRGCGDSPQVDVGVDAESMVYGANTNIDMQEKKIDPPLSSACEESGSSEGRQEQTVSRHAVKPDDDNDLGF